MNRTFKQLIVAGLAAGIVFSLSTNALAGEVSTGPLADVIIDGNRIDISNLFQVTENGNFVIPTSVITDPISGLSVTVGALGIPDPSITYSFAATNPLTSPVPFAFDIAIPLTTPAHAGDSVFTSVGYTLTDSIAGDGVTLTPLSGLAQHATGDGTDLGFNVGPAETGSGSGPLATYTFGGFSTSGSAPFGFSVLDLHLAFSLTGGGDSAGISGAVGVTPTAVPEPGTVALLIGMGTSGALLAIRRRKRRA